jgi:hypothetical protein
MSVGFLMTNRGIVLEPSSDGIGIIKDDNPCEEFTFDETRRDNGEE